MDVLNTSLRLIIRGGKRSFLIALCLLTALCAPVAAADRAPTAQDFMAGQQTMGFEYLRDVPMLFAHGITADLVGQPVNSLLNGAAAMRLNWIRQPVRWADIEPASGVYFWEPLDLVVSEVRIRGFHLLLAIYGTPAWALPELTTGAEDGPPADPATLAHFLSILAGRYAGVVDAYQIWQSPNMGVYWSGRPDPQAYGQLLQTAHQAVKAADPGALVVSADLVLGRPESEHSSVDGLLFLREMVQSGASRAYDALGVALAPSAESPLRLLAGARQLVTGHGEVPIWITSAGWSCVEVGRAAMIACEEEQAAYLVQLATEIGGLDFIQAFMVDNFNLSTVDANHSAAGRSLIRSDWSPRPAFLEYARMRQDQFMATEHVTISAIHNRASQSGPKPHHSAEQK
jgi:hypothetical protein